MIKSNTCPYCGAAYSLNAGGCIARCHESTKLHKLVEQAAISDPGEDAEVECVHPADQ